MLEKSTNELKHIAIIMDGNGRWAKSKFMPRIFGHKKAVSNVNNVIEFCVKNNIEELTLFAFGRENWNRPKTEVDTLMDLFYETLKKQKNKLINNNVKLSIVGDKTRLNQKLLSKIYDLQDLTLKNKGLKLNIAIDYSGQWDIVSATRKIFKDFSKNKRDIQNLTEQQFSSYLCNEISNIDLMIRTSGESRLSNFMLWQLAYSELYFTEVMWPDFGEKEILLAIDYFFSRQRRFGKISEQL